MLPKESLRELLENLNAASGSVQVLVETKVFEDCRRPILRGRPVGFYLEKGKIIINHDVSGVLVPTKPEMMLCPRHCVDNQPKAEGGDAMKKNRATGELPGK